MPRPREYDEHRVSFLVRLPHELADKLRARADAEAERTGKRVSVNRLVERAIERFLR